MQDKKVIIPEQYGQVFALIINMAAKEDQNGID